MSLASRLAPLVLAALAACSRPEPEIARAAPLGPPPLSPMAQAIYAEQADGDRVIPAIDPRWLSEDKTRREVDYWSAEKPGTIVVDPWARRLYYVLGDNRAIRYAVGVGEQGRGFSGEGYVPFTRAWPKWTPTPEMLARDPENYEPHRGGMPGGLDNPLGARALYLFQGGKDTLYRIHGTPYPWTVGEAESSGCIRLFNQDARDLFDRVRSGARVVVLSQAESGRGLVPPAPPLAAAPGPAAG